MTKIIVTPNPPLNVFNGARVVRQGTGTSEVLEGLIYRVPEQGPLDPEVDRTTVQLLTGLTISNPTDTPTTVAVSINDPAVFGGALAVILWDEVPVPANNFITLPVDGMVMRYADSLSVTNSAASAEININLSYITVLEEEDLIASRGIAPLNVYSRINGYSNNSARLFAAAYALPYFSATRPARTVYAPLLLTKYIVHNPSDTDTIVLVGDIEQQDTAAPDRELGWLGVITVLPKETVVLPVKKQLVTRNATLTEFAELFAYLADDYDPNADPPVASPAAMNLNASFIYNLREEYEVLDTVGAGEPQPVGAGETDA